MYKLTDGQIDYILKDIQSRGIQMESLQNDLLDHICCIIENELDESGDFQAVYNKTIQRFYLKELSEIEHETNQLLIFKNYYIMKKLTILSGVIAAAILSTGIFFKFMFWPGTAALLLIGILLNSLVFLPLFFTLKINENNSTRDKLISGLGALVAILFSLHILFKIFHWPGANLLFTISGCLFMLIFVPVYFFTGFRDPAIKNNTIIASTLMVIGCGLFFTLYRTPKVTEMRDTFATKLYLNNIGILETEKKLAQKARASAVGMNQSEELILNLCEKLKENILLQETGFSKISPDFEKNKQLIKDERVNQYFDNSQESQINLEKLKESLEKYNQEFKSLNPQSAMLTSEQINELVKMDRSLIFLNTLTQLQLQVLQNERLLVAQNQ